MSDVRNAMVFSGAPPAGFVRFLADIGNSSGPGRHGARKGARCPTLW